MNNSRKKKNVQVNCSFKACFELNDLGPLFNTKNFVANIGLLNSGKLKVCSSIHFLCFNCLFVAWSLNFVLVSQSNLCLDP